MQFVIGGSSYEIGRDDVDNATRDVNPKPFDGRNKYYVELHGLKYPIKQVIHLVTGLSYTEDFTAQYAYHILKRLGFSIQSLPIIRGAQVIPSGTRKTLASEETTKMAITLEQDENGFIVASVPALPGCHSQGATEEEAIANVKEAIRGYIASMRRHGERIPAIKEVRQVEVLV